MSSLIESNKEAADFCEAIIANIDHYKLTEDESFVELCPSVLMTTLVDAHHHAFARSSLENLVERIGSRPFWVGVEHDPLVNPQGRVIAAKIFESEEEGNAFSFVAAIIGTYDESNFTSFDEALGKPLEMDPDEAFPDELTESREVISLAYSDVEIDGKLASEWVQGSPSLIDKNLRQSLRKELDPITIVTIFGAGILLKPFASKLGEKLGEKAGEEVGLAYDWLKRKVFTTFKNLRGRAFRLQFIYDYKGAHVEFVVPSKDEGLVTDAVDNLGQAYIIAIKVIDQLEAAVPDKLVMEYDTEGRVWRPAHLATQKLGVIADRPTLGALDKMQGLSVGGISPASGVTTITNPNRE